MALMPADKEATLREVLGEVSLLDVRQLLKKTVQTLGCLGIFLAIVFGMEALASNATGLTISDLGIPVWAQRVLAAWVFVFISRSERSFHERNLSWYFPRLGWFSSLLLAAYIVGFIQLNISIFNMEPSAKRELATFAGWVGYTGPFLLFFSAINIGHAKLMEKRAEAASDGR